ncbi:MAG: shikimate kinase [Spirochaetales bacterium]|nr:shikimate kinase [Spirochaetales bacterium]
MKKNITLIGMPGAGKSTTGIILAKNLSMGFLDTDILIQINRGESLQSIMDRDGYLALRTIEEEEILKINIEGNIIATGGSAVYSEAAMNHLKSISRIVFLQAGLDVLKKRITNFETRGIAKAENQTFAELFNEREVLYRRYADVVIDAAAISQDKAAFLIEKSLYDLD